MKSKPLLLAASLLVPLLTLHAENASAASTNSHRLRMEVVRSLPTPVIGKDTPGMDSIPGGFEGGSSVKVMVNGKPEYHLFAHGYPRLDWSQSRLEHWVSPDGANFRRASVLQENFRDEKAGMNHIFCSPVPFYDEKSERWNLIFCEFVAESTWTGDSATIWRAQSKTLGKEGIGGPYDFENRSVFVPKQCAKIGAITPLATACSAPFQVQDGRWAVFVSTDFVIKDEKTGARRQQKWPVMLNFAASPLGPFEPPKEAVVPPLIEPTAFVENPMPLKVRGPKTGRDYWVSVYDFLAPEVTSFSPKNVFGFSWSADGVNWPTENGQAVNIDDGLKSGEQGWWRGAWAVRTPHQMIDEGDGTYSIYFTGGSAEHHFSGMRPFGKVTVRLVEEEIPAKPAWKPAEGPLMTRWAKDVSPANALPEYPRPQMVRKDWMNLNGLWDIKLGDGTETKILVPYPIESALSGVMKHSDRMTYSRSFEIPKDWGGRRVLLHFGAVDWETKVAVNGKEIGSHRGGYDAFSFDITDALKPNGPQEVTVEVFDPTNAGGQPRGKQTLRPHGIMYTPTSGIWQTVWLEPVAEAHIASLKLVPDLDGGCLRLMVEGTGEVEAVASEGGKPVAHVSGPAGTELKLAIPDHKLWSPDSPHLYDLSVTLKSGDKAVDSVTSYFGMRKIALGKDEKGITRPMLNGKFVFQVGPLDQGFWPDGIYTAPTDEALRWDIETMKKLGFNCVRKHIKVEPARWYYWCDKLGLMVWQDMPSASSYLDNQDRENPVPVDKPQFNAELISMVRNHRNHPSIIMWVVFNEEQGEHDTESLVADVKGLDPSRLVNPASGTTRTGEARDMKCGDVIDMHFYPGPGSPNPTAERAAVLGEFGGLGLVVEGHTWSKKVWGYKDAADPKALTSEYEQLLGKAWVLKDQPGLSAVIYTQLTDVESEGNGLVTYDREVIKMDVERVKAANTGKPPVKAPGQP